MPNLFSQLTTLKELYLQSNRLTALPHGVFHCGPLTVLDLSNNQISTIERRLCDNLYNLTAIDLSSNPLLCDCELSRLVSCLQDRGVTIRRANSMLCDRPPEVKDQPLLNASLHTCGLNYAGCLQDGELPGSRELVIFSSSTAGNFSRGECNSLCFRNHQRYGGLGAQRECLCSTNSEPNHISESQCSNACSDPIVMQQCHWTVALDVFQVEFSAFLAPRRVSVHSEALLSVNSSVLPVTLSWDFGDLTSPVNTSSPNATAHHKYGLPGKYKARVKVYAAQKEVTAQADVSVTLPPVLELQCPELLVANHSLEAELINWGGVGVAVDWKISQERQEIARATPICPADAIYHLDSASCFQLVPGEFSWSEARRQCSALGGDLAVVRSESIRNLLAPQVTQERGVWIGLSDSDTPGSLHWVDGSESRAGEEGARDRATLVPGNVCVSLDHAGVPSCHPCSAKRAFVCQFKSQVRVPDAGVFMVGTAVFHADRQLASPTVTHNQDPPTKSVELLLFPALSFMRSGRLSSLEFVTHTLNAHTQVRFQVYRPRCQRPDLHLVLPGCTNLCAPVALCAVLDERTNGTAQSSPSCPSWQQWCPFQERCQPIGSPCHPGLCTNCSGADPLPSGTLSPSYSLVDEVLLALPAGPSMHALVQEGVQDILVFPGDIIALQHDAGPSGLLHCTPDPSSPWRQSMLVQNHSDWVESNRTLEEDGFGSWVDDEVCLIRVLQVEQNNTTLRGPFLSKGLPQPGDYSLEVTSDDPDFPVAASCPIHVVPPLGLVVIHPSNKNGTVYFLPNHTSVLVKVRSQHSAVFGWKGSNETVPFQQTCPQDLVSKVAECRQHPKDGETLFAWVDLELGAKPGQTQVELVAQSKVTRASLKIQAKIEEPLRGLNVQPHPNHRVLMESVVSYKAMVEGGTDPSFRWTVDDKPYFTYYNTVLNVIYQNAAVYKLTVTAMNHVSTLTEHFNVTVDRMNPMSDITVKGVPEIVTQGMSQILSAFLTVDVSVDATFRWSFGDGGYLVHNFTPPFDGSRIDPDFSVKQVVLQHNVTYTYTQPGEYTLIVSVSNRYENKTCKVDVYVFSILTKVEIETDPEFVHAGKCAEFEAHPWPSPYGIIYTWDFGDNSSLQTGRERRVHHIYTQSGIYNICVTVNNTISWKEACTEKTVFEDIEGLTVDSSAPTELHTPTVVTAHLEAGNIVTWTFDMGDGTVLTGSNSQVEHEYVKDGNYTVNVTATNEISSQWMTIPVKVFVLQVSGLEPSGCVPENSEVNFRAYVSGNASSHRYEWSFGDGTPNETLYGTPEITHSYYVSGDYHLSLLMSSGANKANFFAWICVQPAVTNVSLVPMSTYIRLGEESKFTVLVLPKFDYTYLWDFGTNDAEKPIQGGSEMTYTYRTPGRYQVTVTVLNNISCSNNTVSIEVQQPVGSMLIQHNGTSGNNLALLQDYTFTAHSDSSDVVYNWDFGDGLLKLGRIVTYAFNSSGNFNIVLTGRNEVSENKSQLTVLVLAPIQGLSVNASLVNVPLNASVHFEAHLDQGDEVRYSWILCDRCTSILGIHTMFYTFRSVGTFNVIVTAENEISTAQASIFIFVQRELEGLQIVAEDLGDGCCFATNRVLHLQASLKEGTNMSFNWSLLREHEPAPLNLSGKTVDLNFSTPGPCEIILKAANLLGQLIVNRTVEFLDPVGELILKISPNPVAVNDIINATVVTRIGTDLQYKWWVEGTYMQLNVPSVRYQFFSPGLKELRVSVSNRVSSETVLKWVHVQEPISGVAFTTTSVTEQNFVASGVNISLHGEVQTGSDITWTWLLPSGRESGQHITAYSFPSAGTFTITLNATNDIGGQAVSRDFTAQDRIQGLDMKVSKRIVAVGENVEFNVSVSSGTSVKFTLTISGDATVELRNQTYIHQFTRVDNYIVNLTAYNEISYDRRNLHVEVMEPVSRLSIIDCCEPAIPVGVKKSFVADIQTGNPVTFLWTFDLHHGVKTHLIGKEVTYTPEELGILTIFLRAFNSLHSQNVTKVIQVQNILSAATLEAQPRDTFINKSINFHVSVTPHQTSASYQWDFSDGTRGVHSNMSTISHTFSLPGHYLVQVNVSNLVSWVIAKFEVNIRVLECDEPDVRVIQAPRLAIWRYQPALVEANVDLKGCGRYKEKYLWEILTSSRCQDSEHNQGTASKVTLRADVDVHKLQLSVPKMALPAGNYSLVFSLSYEGIPLRKAACLQLSVMSGKLVPIIEGGTYRVWSKTQDLHLSAEQSYDPNLDSQSLLNYHWECVSTSKGPSHCTSLNFGLDPSGPVLGISGSELEADVEYTFRLTVSKEGMPSESTTQTVLVQSGRIPMVSLECVSCKAQSRYEVSQNSYVYLAGTCSNCGTSHRGRWTAVTRRNETLVLDLNTTTTGRDSMRLVLRQGILRDGDSYVFSLHVADDDMDREGVAYIELHPNMPPGGGACVLWPDRAELQVHTLLEKVHFKCSGYADQDDGESPLMYSLLVMRCADSYCEEFCVYKGTSPEHSAFLPPGFHSAGYRVAVYITVEDHQGALITALNKSMEVLLPEKPKGFASLPHWLCELTNSNLTELLKQGNSQRVRELSLALITVLNEYEQTRRREAVSGVERQYRLSVRGNITRALTALDLNTVSDIQQTSAALAQCTAVSREFVCEECQNSTLNKLESMLEILQTDTKQGTVTPTEIADNILNIMGDLIHQVNQAAAAPPEAAEDRGGALQSEEHHPLRVAAKAYTLSSELMRILMHSRVLNEEPLILRGAEIAAAGKRADPQSLLCYGESDAPECRRFSIPRAFNASLGRAAPPTGTGVVQLLFQVEPNPFPFNYVPNYTVSTEVASMEFRTENGTQIPISNLDESQAITVAINNASVAGPDGNGAAADGLRPAGAVNVSRCSSVIVRVSAGNTNRQAGLYVQLNFTVLDEASEPKGAEPFITAYLHSGEWPNEFNSSDHKRITLSMTRGHDLDHRLYTFFLSPLSHDTTLDYFVNVSLGCGEETPGAIRLEVGVFASLCQYFSESAKLWRTDGMVPLAETNASRAVCSTRHLTAFAASLFVPPDAVVFIIPEVSGGPSLVVVLTCVMALLCYAVAGAVLRKLDQLDLRRAAVVPLCGKDGLFKYELQLKTGWSPGAGTTAHVGISLHGRESRSGHRHLDSVGAFARNSLDIFHIATDTSLGNILRIRVWHDNKGLSPAWLLQYVLVKDLQTGSSYFFLVEEWLSVDNEKTDGRVEIEVEASEEAELRRWPRLLSWELQRALCDSHLWLSLWERPPRSPFSRLQRATCCSLLLHLAMLANAVWYGTVAHSSSSTAVSRLVSVNAETLGAGLVSCLLVYPLYLLVFCLFRLSRSKVSVEQLPPQVDQESLEIDDFLDNSMSGSSFLFFHGIPGETFSEETNETIPSTKSVQRWSVPESDWPDALTEPSVAEGAGLPPRLKRGQGSRHLGVDMTFAPEEEDLSAGLAHRNKYFTSSDEDLIKRILADGQLQVSRLCDPQQFFSQADSDMGDLSSIFGDKTEVIVLQKLSEPVPPAAVRRDPPKTAFTSRAVVTDVCKARPLPPWCGSAALWGSWVGLILASALSMWVGRSFSEGVALMWLISSIVSVLSSFFILEPLKVLCEGVYVALVVRRLRPEEQDVLVECPRVERVLQRIPRVRPPQGFALSQAREEARKVRVLHNMLKGFLLYMLFLLVVLLLNYADSAKDAHRLRLHTQLQNRLQTPDFTNISSHEDVWAWLSGSLLPRLLDSRGLMAETGTLLLGKPRLRQIRAQPACTTSGWYPHAPWFGCGPVGWEKAGSSLAQNWSSSSVQGSGTWHWGQVSVYGTEGFVQELNRSIENSRALIQHLHTFSWLDQLTKALFVEFSLYNTNTDLLAVFSFLLEFPVSERAQSSFHLKTCSLHRLSQGLDLSLFLTVLLLAFILYFSIREGALALKEGRGYFLRPWNIAGVCSLALSACVCGLHLSRSALADRLWTSFLRRRDGFTDFYPLASQNEVLSQLNALLLFLLVLKASHQLRFLREWAVFGRALKRSAGELLTTAALLLLLLLTFSHTGYLLFHSYLDGYDSVGATCLSLLGAGGRGLLSWHPSRASSCSAPCLLFHGAFAVLRLVLLWLVTSALLRNYRRARAELYRPAVDLQDYEMVELFLRRLKMWMGLSRAKEFRHKVRFEGMELPPSRSSSTSDCKSLCLPPLDTPEAPPTPDSVDGGSESSWRLTSSSPCSLVEAPGMGLGLTLGLGVAVGSQAWRERAELEATLRRLLPAFDGLLLQLDRVTQATEELYRTECRLEKVQRRARKWRRGERRNNRSTDPAGRRRHCREHKYRQQSAEFSDKRKSSPKREESAHVVETGPHKAEKRTEQKTDRATHRTGTSPHKGVPSERVSNKAGPSPHKADEIPSVEAGPQKTEESRKERDPSPHKTGAGRVKTSESAGKTDEFTEEGYKKGPQKTDAERRKADGGPRKTDGGSPPDSVETVSGSAKSVSTASILIPTPTPAPSTAPASASVTPTPIPHAHEWVNLGDRDNIPSSLFRHPAHTTTIPTRKRKHKPPPLKNKVHPNTDRHISGHPKP